MSQHGWIGVDFDGTLVTCHANTDADIGEPIAPMVSRVRRWLAEGKEVRIVTARANPIGDELFTCPSSKSIKRVEDWCEEHLGQRLTVTYKKDYMMVELWDDRAIQVIPNTGLRADGVQDS